MRFTIKSSPSSWIPSLAIAIIAIIYFLTLSPFCAGGDSGELITEAYLLGVPHPPGYPLYTLLGHLFTYIPFGSMALRLGLFSLVASLLSLTFFYLSARRLGVAALPAASAMMLLGFSPLFWDYAIIAEVFALNNFFITLTLFLALRYLQTSSSKNLYQLCLVIGLSLTHHHTIIFWVGPLALYILFKQDLYLTEKGRVTLLRAIIFGLLGLIPYLYLFIAPSLNPIFSWGATDSLTGFLVHFFRLEYGTFQLTEKSDSAPFFFNLSQYVKQLFTETLYVGPFFGIIGLYFYSNKKNLFSRFLPYTLLAYIIIFHLMANLDFEHNVVNYTILRRFWEYPNILFCLFIALGIEKVLEKRHPLFLGLSFVLALFPLIQIPVHYREVDQSKNDLIENYARIKLEGLPPNAIYLSYGDLDCHILRYLQYAEKVRPDVVVLSWAHLGKMWYYNLVKKHYPQIIFPNEIYAQAEKPFLGPFVWPVPLQGPTILKGYTLNYLLSANITNAKIYLTHYADSPFQKDQSWKEKFYFQPVGSIDRVMVIGESYSFSEYYEESLKLLPSFDYLISHRPVREKSWEFITWNYYWKEYLDTINKLVELANASNDSSMNGPKKKVASLIHDFMKFSPHQLPSGLTQLAQKWQ